MSITITSENVNYIIYVTVCSWWRYDHFQESEGRGFKSIEEQYGGRVDNPGRVGQAADSGGGGAVDGPGHHHADVCFVPLLLSLPVLSVPGQNPAG